MTTRALWSLLVALGLFCVAGTASAQDTTSQPWLHVQISSSGDDDGDGRHGDEGHDRDGRHDDDGDGDGDGRDDDGDGGDRDDDDGDSGDRDDDDADGDRDDDGDGGDREGDDGDDGRDDDGDDDGHDGDDRDGDGDGRHDDDEHGDDDGEGGDFNVNINVPLSAVEPLLGLVPHRILSDGRLTVAGRDMPIDMGAVRGLWRVIADSGDAEFITVDSEDATVRVSRAGEWMLVKVEECDEDGGETVDIRFPVAVLDALFSGDGDTLDIGAAVERLADLRGDIVHVRGDDLQVRVWIDEVANAGQ